MGYLMSLEWKKFKLYKYFKAVAICIIAMLALDCLMVYTSKTEGEVAFENFKVASMFFQVLIRTVFIIFSSVVLSKLVIEEYKRKTIQVMYCYPISRKKLMIAKLAIVYLFTVSTIMLANLIIVPFMGVFSAATNSLSDNLTVGMFLLDLPKMLGGAVLSGFISLIPFYFGMRKKSTPATIVSATILTMILASSANSNQIQNYGLRLVIIGAASFLFVLFTLSKKLDNLQEEEV